MHTPLGKQALTEMTEAERMAALGVQISVLNMASVKPLDKEAVLHAIRTTGHLVTVEDHNIIGGLGSAVAEVIAESGLACRFTRLGHKDQFLVMGVPEDLMHIGEFDADAIVKALCHQLKIEAPADEDWQDHL